MSDSVPVLATYNWPGFGADPSGDRDHPERLAPNPDGFYDLVDDENMTCAPTDIPVGTFGEGALYLEPVFDEGGDMESWTVVEDWPGDEHPYVVIDPVLVNDN